MAILNFAPEGMTSNSSPSPYVASASTEFSATFAAYKAFHRGVSTGDYWLGTNSGVDFLKIDVGSGNSFVLNNYSIQVNTIPEPNRAPKNWTMEGSNDNSSWTTLDTQTNQTSWSSGEVRNYQTTGVVTAYRYFRLNITANNGDANTQVADLFLMYDNGSLDFAPHIMFAASNPYPFAASASSEVSSSFAAWHAFDGSIGVAGYWLGSNSGVDWLKLDTGLGDTFLLDNYTIQVNSLGEPLRAPKDWTMEGSNDNSSWTTVDTRTNQTAWGTSEARNYRCATRTTAYRYFRVNISANNGDTDTQIAELYLFVIASFNGGSMLHYFRLAGIGNV